MATRKRWFVGLNVDNGVRETFQAPYDNATGKLDPGPWSEETGKYMALIGPFQTKRGAVFMKGCHNSPTCQTVSDAERFAKMESDPWPSRTSRGARLLDRERPEWYRKIDREHFDLSTCHHCVLGQLFDGDYTKGLRELDLYDNGQADKHGFNLDYDTRKVTSKRDAAFIRLRALWLKEIDSRLKVDKGGN